MRSGLPDWPSAGRGPNHVTATAIARTAIDTRGRRFIALLLGFQATAPPAPGPPGASREVILLKDIQGLKLDEIAGMLGLPIGTVKSRAHRARLELARQVVAIDPSYADAPRTGGGR